MEVSSERWYNESEQQRLCFPKSYWRCGMVKCISCGCPVDCRSFSGHIDFWGLQIGLTRMNCDWCVEGGCVLLHHFWFTGRRQGTDVKTCPTPWKRLCWTAVVIGLSVKGESDILIFSFGWQSSSITSRFLTALVLYYQVVLFLYHQSCLIVVSLTGFISPAVFVYCFYFIQLIQGTITGLLEGNDAMNNWELIASPKGSLSIPLVQMICSYHCVSIFFVCNNNFFSRYA